MPLFGTIPANQNVEVDPVWVQPGAPSAPDSGELWWDTDETAPGLTTPLTVVNGGTGATSPATARSSLSVPGIGNSTTTAGPPTAGTFARGDQWLDSANVVWTCTTGGTPGLWAAPPGTELYYNQITAGVTVTNGATAQHIAIPGTPRTYDGSPIYVEFFSPIVQAPNAAGSTGTMVNLLDGTTDLGCLAEVYNTSTAINLGAAVCARRRIAPTPGTHNYQLGAWVHSGTGYVWAGPGGTGNTWLPAYLRITRA